MVIALITLAGAIVGGAAYPIEFYWGWKLRPWTNLGFSVAIAGVLFAALRLWTQRP
jgi:hypothetical protein